jgi:hypothetical protein
MPHQLDASESGWVASTGSECQGLADMLVGPGISRSKPGSIMARLYEERGRMSNCFRSGQSAIYTLQSEMPLCRALTSLRNMEVSRISPGLRLTANGFEGRCKYLSFMP